jgi:hypothetical protein
MKELTIDQLINLIAATKPRQHFFESKNMNFGYEPLLNGDAKYLYLDACRELRERLGYANS